MDQICRKLPLELHLISNKYFVLHTNLYYAYFLTPTAPIKINRFNSTFEMEPINLKSLFDSVSDDQQMHTPYFNKSVSTPYAPQKDISNNLNVDVDVDVDTAQINLYSKIFINLKRY